MKIISTTHLFLLGIALGAAPSGGCASDEAAAAPPASRLTSAAARPEDATSPDALRGYIQAMRTDLSRGKVGIINDVMKLHPAEAKKFWPVYRDYEEELFALGDQRVELTRRYVQSHAAGSLDDKAADELAQAWLTYQSQSLELVRKYHGLITAELSPLRAGQFLQIEHRVGTVVDLLIASELPLVRPSTAAGGRR